MREFVFKHGARYFRLFVGFFGLRGVVQRLSVSYPIRAETILETERRASGSIPEGCCFIFQPPNTWGVIYFRSGYCLMEYYIVIYSMQVLLSVRLQSAIKNLPSTKKISSKLHRCYYARTLVQQMGCVVSQPFTCGHFSLPTLYMLFVRSIDCLDQQPELKNVKKLFP